MPFRVCQPYREAVVELNQISPDLLPAVKIDNRREEGEWKKRKGDKKEILKC